MSCRLKSLDEEFSHRTYTCNEVRELKEIWKKNFRIRNKSEEIEEIIGRDPAYESFCDQIEYFLCSCTCEG